MIDNVEEALKRVDKQILEVIDEIDRLKKSISESILEEENPSALIAVEKYLEGKLVGLRIGRIELAALPNFS